MPSSLIIFDSDYVHELNTRMNTACDLLSEAVTSLRNASNHDNWKCKERNMILEQFDELNQKLDRLNNGVNETTRILGRSVSRFASLESRYESQADSLSDELTSNHGFRASVRTGGTSSAASSAQASSSSAAQGTASSAGSTSSTRASDSAQGSSAAGISSAGGRVAGAVSGLAGRISQATGRLVGQRTESSSQAQEGGTMNVNLPVTHIPDNPGAAARGTRHTRDIADAAVSSVVQTMAQALGRRRGPGIDSAARDLADAYNAGRSVFENSASIIASPAMPHTAERLAMAAGMITLAGSASAGLGLLSSSQGQDSGQDSVHSSFSQNAGRLSEALQGNSEASEFRNILGVFASSSDYQSAGSVSGGRESFSDKIVSELRKAFSEDQTASTSSLTASSPIMEFLGNFVMDQV